MLRTPARDIKRGLYLIPSIRQPSIEGDAKDVIEIEMDPIERGQIGESIKRPAERFFLLPDEHYHIVNQSFVKYAARPPDEETGFFEKLDVWRPFYREGWVRHFTPLFSNQGAQPRNRAAQANTESWKAIFERNIDVPIGP